MKAYDAPLFHWTIIIASLAFFALALLGIAAFMLSVIKASRLPVGEGYFIAFICQILIFLSLFLFLYRGFQRFHTILLYTSGWLVFGWLSILTRFPSGSVILLMALYAAL